MSEQEKYFQRKNDWQIMMNQWALIGFIFKCLPIFLGGMLFIAFILFIGVHINLFAGVIGGLLGIKLVRKIDSQRTIPSKKRFFIYLISIIIFAFLFSWGGLFLKKSYFPFIDYLLDQYLKACLDIFISIKNFIRDF